MLTEGFVVCKHTHRPNGQVPVISMGHKFLEIKPAEKEATT